MKKPKPPLRSLSSAAQMLVNPASSIASAKNNKLSPAPSREPHAILIASNLNLRAKLLNSSTPPAFASQASAKLVLKNFLPFAHFPPLKNPIFVYYLSILPSHILSSINLSLVKLLKLEKVSSWSSPNLIFLIIPPL